MPTDISDKKNISILRSDGAQDKVPTNKMAAMNASHGKWKIEMAVASCSSPPAPTPVNTKTRTNYNSI